MSELQSLLHIALAALISTAMIGFGVIVPQRKGMARGLASVRPLWIFAGLLGGVMTAYVARIEIRMNGTPAQVVIVWIALLAALIVALVMIRRGWRGRRVGDHPHCRHCGFDLTGRPATSEACSECGASLSEPNAIVIGLRQRRVALLLGGAFLMFMSVAIAAAISASTLQSVQRINWATYKPEWWLLRDLDSSDPATQMTAASEVWRRFSFRSLSQSSMDAIVGRYVGPPPAQRGRMINQRDIVADSIAAGAWMRGELSEATVRRLLKDRLRFKLTVAPRNTQDAFAYSFEPYLVGWSLPERFVQMSGTSAGHAFYVNDIRLNGNSSNAPRSAIRVNGLTVRQPFDSRFTLADGQTLPPGWPTIRMHYKATVSFSLGSKELTQDFEGDLGASTRIATNRALTPPTVVELNEREERLVRAMRPRMVGARQLRFFHVVSPSFVGYLDARDAAGVVHWLGPIRLDGFRETIVRLDTSLPAPPFDLILRPDPTLATAFDDPPREVYGREIFIPSTSIDWAHRVPASSPSH